MALNGITQRHDQTERNFQTSGVIKPYNDLFSPTLGTIGATQEDNSHGSNFITGKAVFSPD